MTRPTINIVGERYGLLRVTEFIGYRPSSPNSTVRAAWWLCECDCGNKTEVRANSLRGGMTRSCGCLARAAGHAHKDNLVRRQRDPIVEARRVAADLDIQVQRLRNSVVKAAGLGLPSSTASKILELLEAPKE